MPRKSQLARWERDDGIFRVVVFARNDHASFRVESGFRGARLASRKADDQPEAIALAEAIWLGYQRGQVDAPAKAPDTIAELIERVCEDKDHTAKTRKGYRGVWNLFAKHLGKRHPTRIYPLDVRTFLADFGPGTHNGYLRTLRATLRVALKAKWIVEDPTAELKFRKVPRKQKWLPREDWETLLNYCTPAHRIRAEFALETGMRAGEIAVARYDWIHGDVGIKGIRIDEDPRSEFVPKWGKARAIPLSKRALELIEEARTMWPPRHGGDSFIFSDFGLKSLGNLAAETREAVARANAPSALEAGERGPIRPVDFHGLRRSAGARWLEDGASLYEVSQLLGHRDVATTARHYAGVTERHLAAVIARGDAKVAEREAARRSPKRSPKVAGPRKKEGG